MANQRLALNDWLMKLLDEGQFPGVEWIDRAQLKFKIPWLHKSKHGWTKDYAAIFIVSCLF